MPRSVRAYQFLLIEVPVCIYSRTVTPLSFCITVCPTCRLSDHLGIMLGCPCLTVGLVAAESPSSCTMAGKGSCCSTCRSLKDMTSMQSSPFSRSAGKLAQQQELWCVSPLSVLEKAQQAKCTAAVACSSITINASFVTIIRPSRSNTPSCCQSQLLRDPYPTIIEDAC